MKKFIASIFFVFFFIGCSKIKAPEPVDEIQDKGHENPGKVEVISTQMIKQGENYTKTNVVQKLIYTLKGVSGLSVEGDTLLWKSGNYYHFEIVYYNVKGERMNYEFLSKEMAPIHQHFFILDKKTVEEMDEILNYTYQDTDPENGDLGTNGVEIRKQFWNRKNLEAPDSIGLKGIFEVKKSVGNVVLKFSLAHFLTGTKLNSKGEIQKYNNRRGRNGYWTPDVELNVPIEIQ